MNKINVLRKSVLAAAVLAMLLCLAACPALKSIAEINRDPARFMNKEVSVHGTVTESFGALGTGVYRVDDGTGQLWVFSNGYGVPSKGAEIGVAGTIVPTVTFAGHSYATVMRETRRRK